MATVILIDAGYFVGRMQKHWSPKGKMRRAHNQLSPRKSIGFNDNINSKSPQFRFGILRSAYVKNASQSEIR